MQSREMFSQKRIQVYDAELQRANKRADAFSSLLEEERWTRREQEGLLAEKVCLQPPPSLSQPCTIACMPQGATPTQYPTELAAALQPGTFNYLPPPSLFSLPLQRVVRRALSPIDEPLALPLCSRMSVLIDFPSSRPLA